MTKICLDAGHGGQDNGAQDGGLREKDLNLTMVKLIGDMLISEYECEVLLTRGSDVFIPLEERAAIANKWGADYFVSIHHNASESHQGEGFSTYVHTNAGAETIAYQNVMHSEIYATMPKTTVKDLGKERANFSVLRNTAMPAILTENLFIDHPLDQALLKDPEHLKRVARGHVNGLVKAFGLNHKTVQTKPLTPALGFSDVPVGHWAAGAIAAAVVSGLMSGFPDGTFKPEQQVTRAELASILQRLLAMK